MYVHDMLQHEVTANYAQKFISYLTENTIRPYYKDQLFKAV
jgi:hypothetical protein